MFHERTEEVLTILVVPIIFMSLIFVVFVVVPGTYAKIDAEGIDHFTIRNSLLHNKNCLAYENGAVYPGIDDINKVIFLNERMTDRANFCLSKGSFKCSSESVYVLVNENGENNPGMLDIRIIGFEK